jgi:hypothetical protein
MSIQRITVSVMGLMLWIVFWSVCAAKVGYTPDYLASVRNRPADRHPGTMRLYTDPADDAFIYKGKSQSNIAVALKVKIPIGSLVREIASLVINDQWTGGVDHAAGISTTGQHAGTIRPRVTHYEFQFNKEGGAIAAQSMVTISVAVYGPDGNLLLEREYDSGPVQGKPYRGFPKPAKKVNETAHHALYHVLTRACADARHVLISGSPPISPPKSPPRKSPSRKSQSPKSPPPTSPPPESSPDNLPPPPPLDFGDLPPPPPLD